MTEVDTRNNGKLQSLSLPQMLEATAVTQTTSEHLSRRLKATGKILAEKAFNHLQQEKTASQPQPRRSAGSQSAKTSTHPNLNLRNSKGNCS